MHLSEVGQNRQSPFYAKIKVIMRLQQSESIKSSGHLPKLQEFPYFCCQRQRFLAEQQELCTKNTVTLEDTRLICPSQSAEASNQRQINLRMLFCTEQGL